MSELDKKKFLALINERLVSSGERERLKEYLSQRLAESGWKEDVKHMCRETIEKRKGDQITVDDLFNSVSSKSKEIVPESLKQEMIQMIRAFLTESTL